MDTNETIEQPVVAMQYCQFCHCEHPISEFKQGNVLDDETKKWFSEVVPLAQQLKSNNPLNICDASYTVVKNRYDNFIGKKDSLEIKPAKQIVVSCAEVLLLYAALCIFLALGALPIWGIEYSNEISTINASNNGTQGNITRSEIEWTYGASLYYTIVSSTTVGYGDITPSTVGGRAYMEVFLMFSLALTGALIGVISAATLQNAKSLFFLIGYNIRKLLDKCFGRHTVGDNENEHSFEKKLHGMERVCYKFFTYRLVQGILFYIAIWAFILIGGVIFSAIEGWSYQNAHWYCFITLTTIGYGDFVPKTPAGRALCCLYILGGIGLLAAFFGLIGAYALSTAKWMLTYFRGLFSHKQNVTKEVN
jgi:voltage-gated potassium channel Kch